MEILYLVRKHHLACEGACQLKCLLQLGREGLTRGLRYTGGVMVQGLGYTGGVFGIQPPHTARLGGAYFLEIGVLRRVVPYWDTST